MSLWRIDVGPIPRGVKGIATRWRPERSGLWNDLPRHAYAPFVVELPDAEGNLVIETTPLDAYGNAAGDPWAVTVDPYAPVADRPAPKDEVWPDPLVRLDGGVIDVEPVAPVGGAVEEWDHEIRVSENAEAEHEAVFAGYVEGHGRALVNQWPVTAMKVHVRGIRRADRRRGAWRSVSIETPQGDAGFARVVDDSGTNLTASGWTVVDGPPGVASMVLAAGSIRNLATPSIWNTANTESIWGMDGDLSIWGCAEYIPIGEILSPEFDGAVVHEFLPVIHPEFDHQTFTDPCIWDPKQRPGLVFRGRGERKRAQPDERPDRYDRDERDRDTCMWNSSQGGDRGPIEVEKYISLSQDGAAFGDFERVVEGCRYRARAYKLRVRILARAGLRQVFLSKLAVQRWIRNRKWEYDPPFATPSESGLVEYTFDPVPELTVLPVATVAVIDDAPTAGRTYATSIEELTKTSIKVRVWQIDVSGTDGAFSAPANDDKRLAITLMGY